MVEIVVVLVVKVIAMLFAYTIIVVNCSCCHQRVCWQRAICRGDSVIIGGGGGIVVFLYDCFCSSHRCFVLVVVDICRCGGGVS